MKFVRIVFFLLLTAPILVTAQPASIITRVGVATTPIKYYFSLSSALSSGVNHSVKITVSASNAEKTAIHFNSVQLFDTSGAPIGANVASKTDALTGTPYGFVFQNFRVAPLDLVNVAGVEITFLDVGGENSTGKVTIHGVAVSVIRDSGEECVIADPITIVVPPPPIPTIKSIQAARPLIQPGTHGTGGSSGGESSSIGPVYPTVVITSGSGAAWSGTTNIMAADGSRAISTPSFPQDTLNLDASNFSSLASIPSTATINGIVVEIDTYSAPGTTAHDGAVYLIKSGSVISADRKRSPASTWPSSGETVTYGTPTDIASWGAIAPSDLDSTFGVRMKATVTSIGGTIGSDFFRVTVYYTPLGGSVYDSFMDLIYMISRKLSCRIAPSSSCAK